MELNRNSPKNSGFVDLILCIFVEQSPGMKLNTNFSQHFCISVPVLLCVVAYIYNNPQHEAEQFYTTHLFLCTLQSKTKVLKNCDEDIVNDKDDENNNNDEDIDSHC